MKMSEAMRSYKLDFFKRLFNSYQNIIITSHLFPYPSKTHQSISSSDDGGGDNTALLWADGDAKPPMRTKVDERSP